MVIDSRTAKHEPIVGWITTAVPLRFAHVPNSVQRKCIKDRSRDAGADSLSDCPHGARGTGRVAALPYASSSIAAPNADFWPNADQKP